ncbi:MAG: hypothetical protein Q9184_004584 [Pyrenodesmia sp. 2 TL-2023]
MFDTWFKEQIAPDGVIEDGCHPDEAQALQSYLEKTMTTQETAHAITQPILSSHLSSSSNLNRLWNLLQDALVELPSIYIQPLINLLNAIENLPDPHLTTKTPGPANPDKVFTWKGLPDFGHLWADVHKQDSWRNDLSTITQPCSPTTWSDRRKRRYHLRTAHIRRAHIEARLAVADIGSIPLDWGYDAVADALETDRAAVVPDFEVPAAREWIEIAGEKLYQGAREGRKSWALSRKRDVEWEENGGMMDLMRWKFWEGRMREWQEWGLVVRKAGKKTEQLMRTLKEEKEITEKVEYF